MKTATLLGQPALAAPASRDTRLRDYVALTKPRISVLVLFTVGAGVLLAASPAWPLAVLFHAVFGTALVASGASALNQWLEWSSDGLMRRTRNRPLPARRLSRAEVFCFGMTLGVVGTAYLALALPRPTAALLAAITFVLYVGVYTPMKRLTTLNTLVGAIPGAMPPVIGWVAVRGDIDAQAWTLFGVVFLWQVPHFLAIAWMYRDEYERAGLRMLPVYDPTGESTARQMVLYCLALTSVSLAPVLLGSGGWVYLAGALALGAWFTVAALKFAKTPETPVARRVLHVSLAYLPGLLGALILDRALFALVAAN